VISLERASNDARKTLQKELEEATGFIIQLEEKIYRANKTALELLKRLRDSENELSKNKKYVSDLERRVPGAVYMPVKTDPIDRRLAEFLNNFPEKQKLKVMFTRESEGVYKFGSRRVSVRVDQERISIRVGGGYLSIEEFID